MPTIQTGNPGWDQNLSTLGNALFPDPSKIGQGYYYGSEARKAQIEAARLQDQLAATHTATGMQFGHQPNPVYRQGAFQTNIMQEPFGPGGSTGAAVAAPPAAPAAPGQPVQPAQAASTLANTVATTPPAALGTGIVAGFENAATTGPGGEPTGSNGSVPQNGPGPVHPGSVTSAGGGGVTYAPAAAKDGTPAPLDFNFAQNAALMAQGGLSADVMKAVLPATIGNMVKNGQMPQQTGEQIAAFFGVPNMRVQEISNQGAAQVANIQGATQRATTAMTQAGETQRTGMATKFIVTDPGTGAGKEVPLSQLQGMGGTPTFAPAAVTEGVKPIEVQPGGPGTPPISMPTGQAQREKAPIYQSTDPANVFGNFIDPNHPLKPQRMTNAQATARGWMPEPTDPAQVAAVLDQAILNAKGDELTALRERRTQIGPPPKQADAEETSKLQFLTDQQLEKLFPVPPSGATGMQPLTNTHPAGASPDLGPVLSDLADQYYRLSPDPAVRGDRIAATNKALQQLLAEKRLNPQQDRGLGITGTTSVTKPAYDKAGNPLEPQQRFRVDLLDPKTGQPYPPGKAPVQIPMTRPLSSTPGMTPPAPSGAAPIGTAPAGTPDGPRTMGGKPVVVRGGLIYPQ